MTLPGGSSLPADTSEARQYNRLRRRLSVVDFLIGLGLLVVLLATGWTNYLRDLSYDGANQMYGLALFLYVLILSLISKLIGFPLDAYSFRLEHRFHLSNQSLGSWMLDEVKGWLVGFALSVLVVEIIYWLIRTDAQWWWLYAWLLFIPLTILLVQVAPIVLLPIFHRYRPLEDEDLKARLMRLASRAGTRIRGVFEWKLSEKSKKANAALAGLGATRRILLSDTLLSNYTHDEIEAVLAHELGHHVHRHMLKGILLQVVVTFFGFWATHALLTYAVEYWHLFYSLADFANLPLLALVSALMSFLLMPFINAYSRHNERQADRYSWRSIPEVEPYISAMNKLAEQNLAERQPSRLVEVLFHSHPPINKRIQAARVWARTHAPVR